MVRRARPKQHKRRLKSGKAIKVNRGVRKVKRKSTKTKFLVTATRDEKKLVDAYMSSLFNDLSRGQDTSIKDFGNFKVKKTKAKPSRKGRNPFTGETMMFKAKPASRKIKFYPGKKLRGVL